MTMKCMRCGKIGGAWILVHVFVHIVDLMIAAGVAAVATGALVGKVGWPGILIGAVMGMGLASLRERGRRRLGPPSAPEDCARVGDVGGRI